MAFQEDSEEMRTLEVIGKIIRPAIADLDEWPELLRYIVRAETAGASRGHVYLEAHTPASLIQRLRKRYVKCSNSNCNDEFIAIRKHANARLWSIHVSGPGDAHKHCHKCAETKKKTLWVYLVSGQAGRSPRVRKASEDTLQRVMDLR